MTEQNSLLKFKRCAVKRSTSYFTCEILGLVGICLAIVMFIGLKRVLDYFGFDKYDAVLIAMYIILMVIATCLVSIARKHKFNVTNLVKRCLLMHILMPMMFCISMVHVICILGIPILVPFTILIISAVYWNMGGVESLVISLIALLITIPITLAFYDCLHIYKWFDTNMTNVAKWIDLDEKEWL
jgi:hypothetical protein